MTTPEKIQAQQRADAAAKFTREMIAIIRKRLFAGVSEKQWWEHEHAVRQAVLEPARYLQERGAALPASRYRQILLTVVIAIEEHGNRSQIRRMAYYFLHSVQRHMQLQGDKYYEEGKTPRGVSLMVDSALRRMQPRGEAIAVTETLAASAAVLSSRGGRKRKPATGTQQELF